MEAKKKNDSAKAEPAAPAANGPVKVFGVEDVSASVFARERQNKTFYSVSFSRSYRDSAGKRQYVKAFDVEDLGNLVTVIRQAEEFIREVM